jgi:hypothetical protein
MASIPIIPERSIPEEDGCARPNASNTPTLCDVSPSTAMSGSNVSTSENQVNIDNAQVLTSPEASFLEMESAKNNENSVPISKKATDPKTLSSTRTLSWPRQLSKRITSITLSWLRQLSERIISWQPLLSKLVGPEKELLPQNVTVILGLVTFCLFLIFGGFAARYPTPWMRLAGIILSAFLLVLDIVMLVKDFTRKGASIRISFHTLFPKLADIPLRES